MLPKLPALLSVYVFSYRVRFDTIAHEHVFLRVPKGEAREVFSRSQFPGAQMCDR